MAVSADWRERVEALVDMHEELRLDIAASVPKEYIYWLKNVNTLGGHLRLRTLLVGRVSCEGVMHEHLPARCNFDLHFTDNERQPRYPFLAPMLEDFEPLLLFWRLSGKGLGNKFRFHIAKEHISWDLLSLIPALPQVRECVEAITIARSEESDTEQYASLDEALDLALCQSVAAHLGYDSSCSSVKSAGKK
jgi:hypothetical protein